MPHSTRRDTRRDHYYWEPRNCFIRRLLRHFDFVAKSCALSIDLEVHPQNFGDARKRSAHVHARLAIELPLDSPAHANSIREQFQPNARYLRPVPVCEVAAASPLHSARSQKAQLHPSTEGVLSREAAHILQKWRNQRTQSIRWTLPIPNTRW